MTDLFLIIIVFFLVVMNCVTAYYVWRVATICYKSFDEVWTAIKEIQDGSYLIKED